MDKTTPVMTTPDPLSFDGPPTDLEVVAIGSVNSDQSVEVFIRWRAPGPDSVVDLYTIYHSTDQLTWASADVTETSMSSRVKTELPIYFYVVAINSRYRSPQSEMFVFYPEKEANKANDLEDASEVTEKEEANGGPMLVVATAHIPTTTGVEAESTTSVETATAEATTTASVRNTATFTSSTKSLLTKPSVGSSTMFAILIQSDYPTTTRRPDMTSVSPSTTASVVGTVEMVANVTKKLDKYVSTAGQSDTTTAGDVAECQMSEHGCCEDGVRAATGPGHMGCGPYELTAPKNFVIQRTAIASDRVGIRLSWDQLVLSESDPIVEYTIRFTDNRLLPMNSWRGFTLPETEYNLALRNSYIYYFTIYGVTESGKETESSPLYKYDPTELRSSRCLDIDCQTRASCELSRYGCCDDGLTEAIGPRGYGCPEKEGCLFSPWGCCSDGVSTAVGPQYLGCIGDPQPCDVSRFGCCPDGETEAEGDNFEGCAEFIQKPDVENTGLCDQTGESPQRCQDFKSLAGTCQLKSDTGKCANYTINWYYDSASGVCRRFWYGGCEGNSNRFKSKKHCDSVCSEPPGTAACYLSAVAGRCDKDLTRWHYDPELMTCNEFKYGGCAGNNNNFVSQTDCLKFCQPSADERVKDVCSQPMEEGLCRGSFLRYWYNRRTGNCERFTYSGCHGNDNRFTSEEFCNQRCIKSEEQDVCSLAKDTGVCLSLIPSWHYDMTSGTCSPFYYGGCGGNENRFSSQQQCQQSCMEMREQRIDPAVCLQPVQAGSCSEVLTRYAYNSLDGSCKPFVYSGCGANDNNFFTQNSCERSCAPAYETDRSSLCKLPEDEGNCGEGNSLDMMRWRYDNHLEICVKFVYTGCRGNGNNFATVDGCIDRCEIESFKASDVCLLPKSEGKCDGAIESYYYSPESGKCHSFMYSGCGGTANRFTTELECNNKCSITDSLSGQCSGGVSVGDCFGSYPRWHYNDITQSCEIFVYSGCGGNTNNYLNFEECIQACDKKIPNFDDCSMDVDQGVECSSGFLSLKSQWFYDRRQGSCQQFTYRGCQGNRNRFGTKDECSRMCPTMSICSLPLASGQCYDQIPMYRYDVATSECVRFTYSGCGGNANQFETRAMCEIACLRYMRGSEETTSNMVTPIRRVDRRVCELPVARGPCEDLMLSYYYDSRRKNCRAFVYSGCEGNANRFATLTACRQHCMGEEETSSSRDVCGPEPTCFNSCPDGFLLDGRGCATCQCRDLCRLISCNEVLTHCVVQRKDCTNTSILDCTTTAEPVCIEDGESGDVAPYVTRPTGTGSQYVRTAGGNVVLPCNALGSPKPIVVWYKNRRPLVIGDRTSVSSDHSLTIRNLQASDGGEYICRAFNRVGDPVYEYLTLTIHEGVIMLEAPAEYIGPRGSEVTIPCKVLGTPKPDIFWINKGEVLPESNRKYNIGEDNSLTVYDVSVEDAGDYVCIAKNPVSSASKTFTLKIRETLRVSLQDHNSSYVEGDTLTLACITEGFPPAKVEWLKTDQKLPYDSRITITDHTLEIRDLEEDDSGFYTCIATNEHEALSLTTTIEVKPATSLLPDSCTDSPDLANCQLIVYYNFCLHPVYSIICCRSCELNRLSRL
ncbi:papilin-like isoform X1 [Watersipora subatra]|uniref:papilin-like isoform X1 n=1 Tax=Watersipora subatra TaxID=2589382 RepID=UPI00355C3E2D